MRNTLIAAIAAVAMCGPAIAANTGVENWYGAYKAKGNSYPSYEAAIKKYYGAAVAAKIRGSAAQAALAFKPPTAPVTTGPAGDYLSEMVGDAGVDHWAPEQMPLRVYIGGGSSGFQSTYPQMFTAAMNEWSNASGGRIRWTRVTDPSGANIIANWDAANASSPGEAGNTRTQYGMGPNGERVISFAEISIMPTLKGTPYTDEEMHKICLHEIGHALGLRHSSNSGDIMFWQSNYMQLSALGPRDANTIKRLYGNP